MIKANRLFFRIFNRSDQIFSFSKLGRNLKNKSALQEDNQSKKDAEHLIKDTLQSQHSQWKGSAPSYGQEIKDILQKKDFSTMDLVFLSKLIQDKKMEIDEKMGTRLKQELKKLRQIQFEHLIFLLQLSEIVNKGHYANSLKTSFVKHFETVKFETWKIRNFPVPFLKEVGFNLFTKVFSKGQEETAEVLKTFGSVMSVDEMKKVDTLCCNSLSSMEIDGIVRLLNIFRQLKRKGEFVDLACELIIQKQQKISPKYLLMTVISLLELGYLEAISSLEGRLLFNLSSQKGFDSKEIMALLQVFHKFKAGSLRIWQTFQTLTKNMNLLNSFDHLFALLSGLTRNYKANPVLLLKFLSIEPSLAYVKDLNEKQFIQFFLVLYFHYISLDSVKAVQFQPAILQALQNKQEKSVYKEIKHFFLYLFSKEGEKKDYLKKAYPEDIQLALLSLAFPLHENIDTEAQGDYEKDLLERYESSVWDKNKKIIVVEEFIRHKLISAKKEEFKDHLI